MDFSKISEVFDGFGGAKRRFQVIHRDKDFFIVDDYAHHPTEIKATIQAAKAIEHKRLIAVFQPQRYSRTYYFYDEFAQAFDEADETIIADIYTAGEQPIAGVSSQGLVDKIKARGKNASFVQTPKDVKEKLLSVMKPGDIIITMGAGDIWKSAHHLAEALQNYRQVGS